MRTMIRPIVLLLLVLLLAGCGVRMAYNNLDRLMLRWVDSQVSLDSEQTIVARGMIESHLDWHCATELPDYAIWLRRIDADIGSGQMTVEVLEHHAETMTTFWHRLLTTMRPSMIEMIALLSDHQLEELEDAFAERNKEIATRAKMGGGERLEQRVDSMERGLRRFMGRLDGEQRRRLESWAGELKRIDESTLDETLRWQQAFFEVARNRHDPEFEHVVAGLLDPANNWSDEHWELMAHNRERTLHVLSEILDQASDRQVGRLRSRLVSLADDFDRLTCL